MSIYHQVFLNKVFRLFYGRSPFKSIVFLTVVALFLLFLSKMQIFKKEFPAIENLDFKGNPKLINFKERNQKVLIISTRKVVENRTFYINTSNISNEAKINSEKIILKSEKKSEYKKKTNKLDSDKVFSHNEKVVFNVSFNLIKENLIKVALNDILLKGLNEESQKLQNSLKNKPLDFDKNARFCKCTKVSQPCMCCVTLSEESIGLTKSLCSNITYLPKRKVAKISMEYGNLLKSDSDVFISIDNPPLVCLSEFIKYDKVNTEDNNDKIIVDDNLQKHNSGNFTLEICFEVKNLTYNVNIDTSHRTEFRGCSNMNVKLNEMLIRVYPLGCFKAGHDSKSLQIQKVINGIP